MKYLLDTNVISEINKTVCDQNVKTFLENINWKNVYLSAITIGEICYGVEKLPVSKKKHELSIWLYQKLPQQFNKRIISLSTELFYTWGKLLTVTKRTLPVIDSIIAASAIHHNMILITRNIKDFDDIEGINLINPWEV
ncbi:MAG: type II toxin-antitoxin system VapC family toxin [Treponema sp.]|nr:type II toxin-antitoxin system VapC family toxin [Treponema sp.]MCL2252393.1 type II toxin-antitoxin system VapC family toxin [Treponema sp.]